jgi:hypothetical protein
MQTTDTSPAGGAEILEVILATGGALLATIALLWLGFGHRSGRVKVLGRVANLVAKDSGLAPWAALPSILAAGSLLVALLGMYWDISLHIDDGRDAGPLANPAHYLILFGLYGIFAAGFLAIVLPEGKPSPAAVRINESWYAPLGGVAMMASSAFALIGFPLDDVWHRIFGQDVTLWGPTHLMLIGGAGLTLIGSAILLVEGRASSGSQTSWRARFLRGRRTFAFGGLLIGLSTFQAEFDFGVPQFNLVLEPLMLAFAAGVALVGARIWIGPGAALGAAIFFVVVRGVVALLVGPVLGETTPHLPLYLVEALCVEGAALLVSTRRPYAFAALSGGLIGTVGFAAEYAWSHVWMPIAWPETLISDALPATIVVALGAAMIGSFMALALGTAEGPDTAGALRGSVRPTVLPAAVGLAAIAVAVGLNVFDSPQGGIRGEVRLSEVTLAPERTVDATVRITPASAVEGANWINVTSWQGGGLVVDDLERTGPGVYETSEPVPVSGTWKTLVRIHRDDWLMGLPIYLPEDEAIPADAVPAKQHFTRGFTDETEILQRELKSDVPGYLAGVAYAVVGGIVLGIIVLLGWVLSRLGGSSGASGGRRPASLGRRGSGRALAPGA